MLNVGESFGDYTVERLLGKGGMGSVFLLTGANCRRVAAKILDPAMADDHESRKRFLREAELTLGVKHPNLVRTYDVGEDPDTGLCYILMEYVPGGSLANRLDRTGPLPVKEALSIVYQIASVLELAKEKGIVHRDIKPDNIMFGADGKAKLADLGIARQDRGTNTTTVTQTGMMIGTPAYMAPEQMVNSHAVDCRADIYSLGIVFYEMLTGERPNAKDTVVELMAKAMQGVPIPDVRKLRPEISASVAELISLMCAMKADERVSTPVEVTTAISQIAHGRPISIRRKRPASAALRSLEEPSTGRMWKIVGGVVFAVGLAGFGVYGYLRAHRPSPAVPVATPQTPAASPRPATPAAVAEAENPAEGRGGAENPEWKDLPRALGERPDNWTFNLPGGVSLELVGCPAGEFVMGDGWAGSDLRKTIRPHRVKISRKFWFGKFPVTRAQWNSVAGRGFRRFEPLAHEKAVAGDDAPATRLSICDGLRLADELTRRFRDQIPSGYVFRFPTEAEWEYALRANSTDPADPYARRTQLTQAEYAEIAGDYEAESLRALRNGGFSPKLLHPGDYDLRAVLPVGRRRPNAWGIHDMIGCCSQVLMDMFQMQRDPGWGSGRRQWLAEHVDYREGAVDPLPEFPGLGWPRFMIHCVENSERTLFNRTVAHYGGDERWKAYNGYRLVLAPNLMAERWQVPKPSEPVEVDTGVAPRGIELPGKVRLDFVGCPAGEFRMAGGRVRNRPSVLDHEVEISRPFWLGRYPVTCDQWTALTGEELIMSDADRACGGGSLPRTRVTAKLVEKFLELLNRNYGKDLPPGYVFRLPSSAEWWYACKAGCRRGRNIVSGACRGDVELAMAWRGRCLEGARDTGCWSVGAFEANAWGLYDMVGNCWEFTLDRVPGFFWRWMEIPWKVLSRYASYPARAVDPVLWRGRRDQRWIMYGQPGYPATEDIDLVNANQEGVRERGFRVCIGPDLVREGKSLVRDEDELLVRPVARTPVPSPNGRSVSLNLSRDVKLDLLRCPSGRFTMGDFNAPGNEPHRVEISRPFWLGRYPVTVAQWELVTGRKEQMNEVQKACGGKSAAVAHVTREMIEAFCTILNRRFLGKCRAPKGYVFRLPTDAEWEYACRADSTDKDDPHVRRSSCPADAFACAVHTVVREDAYIREIGLDPKAAGERRSFMVGTREPNAWGFYDMLGNVWEMTYDCHVGHADIPELASLDYWHLHRPENLSRYLKTVLNCEKATDPLSWNWKSNRRIYMMRRGMWSLNAGVRHLIPCGDAYPDSGFRLCLGPNLVKERNLPPYPINK